MFEVHMRVDVCAYQGVGVVGEPAYTRQALHRCVCPL